MNMEDHAGDVVRKSRLMLNLDSPQVARAAGWSEAELAAFEDSGKTGKRPNFAAVGALLQLNPAKLEALAGGWAPPAIEASTWRELRIYSTAQEGMSVNCYLIWDEASLEAALFDTGWDAGVILATVAKEQLQLRHIFITHSHHDHVAALADLRSALPKVRIHSSSRNVPMDQRNKPNEIVHVGGLRVTYRETPGHAEDGVTYLVGNWPEDAPHVALVGDAIFAGSMGGAPQHGEQARRGVREQILTLPEDTLICPGHGPVTTVREEKAHNPFF